MTDISTLAQDAIFAAVAAIGFASISHPPRRAFLWCALLGAIAHALRTLLIGYEFHIILSSGIASLVIGVLAVIVAPFTKTPPETYLFPALLPMIPGAYAYKTIEAMLLFVYNGILTSDQYLHLMVLNGLTCSFIVLAMAVGGTAPIYMFKRISFQSTR